MDAVLHWRTRASSEGLASRLATLAPVYRDGVVVGGDGVPALHHRLGAQYDKPSLAR